MTRLRSDEGQFSVYDTGTGYAFTWTCSDGETWRDILDDLKVSFPHWTGRRYDPNTRLWHVRYDCRDRLARWADSWFTDGAQEWHDAADGDHHTYGRTSSSQGGYERYTSQQATTIGSAFSTLHLLPSAPLWAAEAVYRAAVKVHHPDHGGDHQAMVTINGAIETIRASQQQRAR